MQSAWPGSALVINQSNNKTDTEIKYKNLYTLHEILGYLKAPGGENISQKKILTTKSESYVIKALTSSLTHREAKMYYNCCYIKSAGYVLGQCFFTQEKLKEIEKDAICVFTSQTWYNKNMAKVIQDGPEFIAGAVFTRLIYVQESKQEKPFFNACIPIVKPKNGLSLRVVGHNINAGGIYLF
eukprot:7969157-Ditylum_brightwellii.AAC.1